MWKFLALCLLVLPGCRSQNEGDALEVQINIDISESRVHEGADVTMVCRVVDIPADGFIYWFKSVMTHDGGQAIDTIALTTQPLPPYDRLTRFSFAEASAGTSKIYTMKVTNVTEQDNGHYGCSYREIEENIFDSEMFEVYSAVDNITILADGEEIGVGGITTNNTRPTYIEVYVGETMPKPVVSVYIGNHSITEEFSYHSKSHVNCTGTQVGKVCPVHALFSTEMWGNYTFDGNADGKMFKIVAKVPGSGFDLVNKSVALNVEHAPLFKCATEQFSRRGLDFTISCQTNANPTPDRYYWKLGMYGEEEYAWPGQYLEKWHATASVTHDTRTTDHVYLHITEVSEMHYTSYVLVVGNEYNNNSLSIKLSEDFTPVAEPSGANFLSSTIVMMVAAFIICVRYD